MKPFLSWFWLAPCKQVLGSLGIEAHRASALSIEEDKEDQH